MKQIVLAAALALVMGGQQTQAPQQPQQQNQIPDAPKPQMTGVGPIAPGIGATAESGSAGAPMVSDPDQQSAPILGTSQGDAKTVTDATQQTPPELPTNSQDYLSNPLHLQVNTHEVPFIVKDRKGRLVPGIQWNEVHVYENNVRQHPTVFTTDPYPLSIAVVIDQSLGFHDMAKVNNALGALQDAFTTYDEVALITYNNGPKLQTDFTGGQSKRLTAIIERSKAPGRDQMYYAPGEALEQGININNNAERNETPLASGGPGSPQGVGHDQVQREPHTLNDAILLAAQTTAKAGRGRRRVVYVISDGKEYGSTAKTKDVIKYLQEHDIEVVATLIGDASVKGMGFVESIHLPLMMRDNILPVYTKATGGEFYADYMQKGIETSFAKIAEEARTQYTVWYNSREPLTDGKFRKVEVRVLRPNLQVIAEEGYYPTPRNYQTPPLTPVSTTPPAKPQP